MLFIDFETRSAVDLPKAGAYRYAEDKTTDALCLAVMRKGEHPRLWVPKKFHRMCRLPMISDEELQAYVYGATEIHAHNCLFERRIWKHIMTDRYGFPDLPLEKCRCTAAKAAAMNIPRNLDGACEAMGLPGKDKAGKAVMMRMCKPRRILKADREEWEPHGWVDKGSHLYNPLTEERKHLWHETPEEFEKNARYCLNDVEIEYALDSALPDLSAQELEVWRMDQRMNDRGVRVDLPLVKVIYREAKAFEEKLTAQMQEVTHGTVSGPTKLADLGIFLRTRGVVFPDLQKATVKRLLVEGVADPEAEKALRIRLGASKATSCKKYEAILRCVCRDERIHDMFMYYGAQATGRWSSKGVQLQNLARGELSFEAVMAAIAQFHNYGGLLT